MKTGRVSDKDQRQGIYYLLLPPREPLLLHDREVSLQLPVLGLQRLHPQPVAGQAGTPAALSPLQLFPELLQLWVGPKSLINDLCLGTTCVGFRHTFTCTVHVYHIHVVCYGSLKLILSCNLEPRLVGCVIKSGCVMLML